jgi:hypothetical protein
MVYHNGCRFKIKPIKTHNGYFLQENTWYHWAEIPRDFAEKVLRSQSRHNVAAFRVVRVGVGDETDYIGCIRMYII